MWKYILGAGGALIGIIGLLIGRNRALLSDKNTLRLKNKDLKSRNNKLKEKTGEIFTSSEQLVEIYKAHDEKDAERVNEKKRLAETDGKEQTALLNRIISNTYND